MPAHTPFFAHRTVKPLIAVGVATLLAACSGPQESASRYDTSRENTRLDAESNASAGGPRAASQLKFGFGETEPTSGQAANRGSAAAEIGAEGEAAAAATEAEKAAAPRARPLAEARSFLGTVPCPTGITCEASRVMVTLAPSGEWRARTVLLVNNRPTQTLVDQGCWQVIGDAPMRIALIHPGEEASKGDFTFVNDNTLRVNTLNGIQPVLEHRLTRQADIDGIEELQGRPALSCA